MSMSYRHAWELVESMNQRRSKPLVVNTVGGRGGGGAKLTADGEQAITIFWRLYNRFKEFLNDLESELESLEAKENKNP